ncbi:MAG TPA: hypothetical protein ENI61_02755 [Ignavibacteria bacterium]|nr:hypothetical protein [Ignavibacteria bacterium]
MDKKTLLNNILSDTNSILENIKWNMGGLIGIISLISNPQMYFLPSIPLRINIEDLNIDSYQCLGISLLEKDRKHRIDELLASAKRSLICESLEISADSLVRVSRIMITGNDPYQNDDYFNTDIRELWNPKNGKAGALLNKEHRHFFEKCIAPLRNYIRHHNGIMPPNKFIKYEGNPAGKDFTINYEWRKDKDNNIKIKLDVAFYLFESISNICIGGINKGLIDLNNKNEV